MEDLKKRIAELENELKLEKSKNESSSVMRPKIEQMSSEVVDSNPYRFIYFIPLVFVRICSEC